MNREKLLATRRRARNTWWLIGLVAAAAGYALWLNSQFPAASGHKLAGLCGVALGLFIGSQPVANFLEALLFPKHTSGEDISLPLLVFWLAANLLAFAAGWFAIMIGAIRFTIQ